MVHSFTLPQLLLTVSLIAVYGVDALNDWNVPCTQGWCSWDTGDGVKTAWSSLVLNGGTSGLSDITTVNGFAISNCKADWADGEANVQLTCTDPTKCNHLFEGGAQDTVVRLPPNCGTGPFARVTKCDPTGAKSKRAANATTIVKGQKWDATLSFDFQGMDPSSKGKITMFLTTSNVKGASSIDKRWAEGMMYKRGRDAYLHRRGLFDSIKKKIDDGINKVKDVGSKVVNGVESAAKAVATEAKDVGKDVVNGVKTVAQKVEDATAFNKTDLETLKPISIQKTLPIFSKNIGCGPITGNIDLSADTDVEAVVGFGYAVIGTIVPPKLDDFNVMATLNGNVTSTFNIGVGLQGSFDTGLVPLFTSGLPGLSIPGIASIGPEFSLNAELTAQMDIAAQMAVNTGFSLPNINFVFPPDKGASSGGKTAPAVTKQPLKVSVGDGTATANGVIDAHLIPRLDFGVDLLKGFAKATVFLELDASGTLTMQVEGSRTVTPPADKAAADATATADDVTATDTAADATATDAATTDDGTADATATDDAAADPTASDTAATDETAVDDATATTDDTATEDVADDATTDDASAEDPTQADPAADTTAVEKRANAVLAASGSVSLDGSIFITGGLDGQLAGLFNKALTVPIFNVTKNIFTKSFGTPDAAAAGANATDATAPTRRDEANKRALSPPKPGPAGKLKQAFNMNCFASGSFLGGGVGAASGFPTSLLSLPL